MLSTMMEISEDDDIHGMDYGDYLERLNLMLKAMVELQERQGIADTSTYLAQRFDEPMLSEILQMLHLVQSVLELAISPETHTASRPPAIEGP